MIDSNLCTHSEDSARSQTTVQATEARILADKECGSCKERQWVGRVKKRVSKHVKSVNTGGGAMPSYVSQLGILLTVQIGI